MLQRKSMCTFILLRILASVYINEVGLRFSSCPLLFCGCALLVPMCKGGNSTLKECSGKYLFFLIFYNIHVAQKWSAPGASMELTCAPPGLFSGSPNPCWWHGDTQLESSLHQTAPSSVRWSFSLLQGTRYLGLVGRKSRGHWVSSFGAEWKSRSKVKV